MGPRNDVLPTSCKAVTLRGGQRIIAVRSEPGEEMIKNQNISIYIYI